MSGFARCSRLWLVVTAILTIAVMAHAQSFASSKNALNNTQQEASGSGGSEQTKGAAFVGSMGITETVDEIMARQRAYDAQPHLLQGPHETKPEPAFELHQQPNPAAPDVPQWPPREANALISATPFNPQTVGTNFLAITLGETPGFIPPDTIGAVGPTQIMATVNGRLKVFDKTGALGPLNVDMDTFWASVRGSSGVSDQHVRYDRLSQRWFVVGINVANTSNLVLLAVSGGPTITGTGSFTFFQFSEGVSNFFDYPTLGIDANALYVGANMFTSSVGSFVGTNGYVIRKSSVTSGGPIVVTTFNNIGTNTGGIYTPQGVDNDDPNSTEGYFIGIDAVFFSRLDICRVSTPGATPTINCSLSLTVPTTVNPISVPANGTSTTLDALDGRLFAAAMHKNKNTGVISLWTAHNFEVNSSGVGTTGGGRDGSRWYEITNMTSTPTLNQSGTLFDPAASNPIFYWIPSVAMSGQGHMALGTSRTQATTFTGISVAGRLFGDALGTTQAPTVAQAGVAAYDITVTDPQRWGDFSQTVVDPTDDMTMWTVQEYANATNSWGTRVIKLIAPPPATPSSASPPSVAAGQSSVSVTVTGTSSSGSGFFDPGPDTGGPGYPNHISATVSGGVTVNSVTFTDPTHVNLSLNTTAATVGLKTVTITNPDGQTAAANILTITSGALPPSIAKIFGAASIPFGASTSLTFTINNPNASQSLSGLAFTDTLPGGLVVATPNGLSNTCGGTATATAGSSSVSLSAGTLAASASCSVSVNVTGTTAGTKTNSVTVTSTEGGTGNTSNASLTVVAPPNIVKSFFGATVPLNATTSLSFTITNPAANTVALTGVAFTDTLPAGLTVASSTASVCGGTLTTTAPSTIALSGANVVVGTPCQFSVVVTGATVGLKNNSVQVTSTNGGTGNTSNASITVVAPPTIAKAFNASSIPLNGTSTLTFTINNPNVSTDLTGVSFTDTLPSTTGTLVVSSTPNVSNACSGSVTANAGSSVISLSGGTVTHNTSCTLSVDVKGTAVGDAANTTGAITSTEGSTGLPSNTATIKVVGPPTISKAFGAASIQQNGTTTVTFTITNPAGNTTAESGIAFTDTLTNGLQVAGTPGVTNNCGGTVTATAGSTSISLSGGTIPAPGGTCTVVVNVTGTQPGNVPNTTGAVSSTNGGTGTASNTANLAVVAPPTLSKAFNPTSIPLNATSLLTFTVTNPAANTTALTGVAFTDTLPAGLTVATNTFNNCSGGTVTTTAPRTISLSGGSIATNSQCTFGVTVTGAVAGSYSNIVNGAGTITSTNGGTGVASNTAPLTVVIPATISKSFSPKSIPLNGNSTLSFTVTNPNTASALSGIAFTDTLPGGVKLASTSVTGSCGSGTITATINNPPGSPSTVSLSGGTLTASPGAGSSCTFSVGVTGISTGAQVNTTSTVSSTEGGTGGTASDTLTVIAPPTIAKSFGAPRVAVTGTAQLSFTITNPNTTTPFSGVAFSDTLPSGLVINTPNGLTGSCGSGTITATQGTSVISLSGGTLAASAQCMFSVTVLGTAGGDQNNTTGNVTSTEGGTGGTASATINVIAPPTLSLALNPTSIPLNGTTSLQFTITNPAANTTALNSVAFTDTLPAGLTVANSSATVCGGTLTTTNPTAIQLSGATVNQNSQCIFSMNVAGAAAGSFSNIVSGPGSITSTTNGIGATGPPSNTVNLTVVAPPTISKAFGAASITLNGTTSLTFTITNPAGNTTSENGIAFADTLSAGLQVASPNGLTNNCGGTATAVAGSTSISLSGGSIAASGANCTIVVNITGTATGIYTNTTGPISSTNGGTGATSNTAGLTVALPPSISKMFGASGITVGGSTSLSFTINNSNTNVPLTGIAFNDPLPAGLVVSTPNGQTGSCGAGTITAIAGSGSISLTAGTLPASGSCTFSVNVTGTTIGTKNNTTSAVTSNEGGNGNTASASINVDTGVNDISLALTHAPDPVAFGGRLIFTATVTAIGPNTATVTFTEGFVGPEYVVSPVVSSRGSCNVISGSVSCNLGQMTGTPATPQVATVTVTLTPLLGNSIQATGTVTSDITNPDPNTTKMDTGRVRIKARSRD